MWLMTKHGMANVATFDSLSFVDCEDWCVIIGSRIVDGQESTEPIMFFDLKHKEAVTVVLCDSMAKGHGALSLVGPSIDPPEGWAEKLGYQMASGKAEPEMKEPPKPKVLDYFRLDLGDCDPRSLGAFVGGRIAGIEVAGRVVAIKVEV